MTEIQRQDLPGDPLAVHWVVHTGSQDVVGEVLSAPGPLGDLLRDGVVSLALLETEGIWIWLSPGKTWDDHADEVRDAIVESLALDGWRIRDDSADLLRLVATDVIEGDLAETIRAADTTVEVVENDAQWLLLDLGRIDARGPAASEELQFRIEAAIRFRYPILREVARVGGPQGGSITTASAPRRALWTDE